jgi:hypothetical protein
MSNKSLGTAIFASLLFLSYIPTTSALNTILVNANYSDAYGWNLPQYYSTIAFPDVNGDGRTDVCGRGTAGIWCAVDDGTTSLTNTALWNSTFSDASGWNLPQYYSTIAFPDLNGDGKADVCGRGPAGIWCALSIGSSFGPATLWNADFNDANGWAAAQYYSTIRFADVNGDGKADICGRGPAGIWCALSNGSSFGTVTLWNAAFSDANGWAAGQYNSTISFADVNGDGKADVCGRGVAGIYCALSNGGTFGNITLWNASFSDAYGWNLPQYYGTIRFADINGDGKADLCGRATTGIYCALSNGGTFGAATLWNANFSDAQGWNAAQYYTTIRLVGGVLCGRGAGGIYCAFSNSANAFTNELLDSSTESDANGWTQPAYYSTIGLTSDLKIAGRGGAGIQSSYVYKDNLSINTVNDLNNRRTQLISKVWGRSTVDTTVDSSTVNSDTLLSPSMYDVAPLPAGVTVRRYVMNMATSGGSPISGGPAYVQGLADHFIPSGGSSKLVILNPGHTCHYTSLPFQDAQTVTELLAEGYAVLATYMPRATPLDCPPPVGAPNITGAHQLLFDLDPKVNLRPFGGGNPLIYFLDPVRRSLNYVLSQPQFAYTQIYMAGLSGGGWTTTLYAALDTRITTSVPVAGSEPFYMRLPSDAEQENNPAAGNDFFHFSSNGTPIVTGYKDLYLLGSYGSGRRQAQVLNRDDDCCFGQNEYIGASGPWDQVVRAYELEVRQRLGTLGAGAFRVEINEADDCLLPGNSCGYGSGQMGRHEFSKNTRVGVILAEFNGSNPYLGVSNNAHPLARGMNGHLWQSNGPGSSWVDTNLPVVGTPAVIQGAVNPMDVFYRDSSNNLAHAYYNGSSWVPAVDVSGVIISDPTAISWGLGRIDVVAVGSDHTASPNCTSTPLCWDYKIYHWIYNGTWTRDVIDVLAVGLVALTSSGPNHLDIFFRGHDANLYHVSSNGTAPYTVENTGAAVSGAIKNFPVAASTTSNTWAYVTGTDNSLYQGQPGQPWHWSNLSAASGATSIPVLGSPSAYQSGNSAQNIYGRITSSQPDQLGIYSLVPPATTWQFANYGGGPLLGSPTSANLGVFSVDTSHAAWQFDANGWHALGGYLER